MQYKKLISPQLAANILLVSFGILIIFHVLVLLGVVPSDIVWGGQAQSSIIVLEVIALAITALLMVIVAAKIGYIKAGRFKRIVNIAMWLIFAFLVLNTIGNLASGVSAENWFFAPITILLALVALRLAME